MGARTWGLGRYAEAAGSIILLRTRRRAGRRARGQVVEAGSCRGTWVAGAWSLGRECIGTSRWGYATTECGQLVEEPGCWSVAWDDGTLEVAITTEHGAGRRVAEW